jgi:DNA-binding MarR family transcriptional regulator
VKPPSTPPPEMVMATVPGQVFLDRNLVPLAKLLFGHIYAIVIQCHKCFISNDVLAQRLNVKPRHVRRLLEMLQDKKYIQRIEDEAHHREEIVIIWKPGTAIIKRRRKRVLQDRKEGEGGHIEPGGRSCTTGGAVLNDRGPNLLERTPSLENPPPTPPKPGGGVDDLLDLAKTIGLRGATRAKLADAVSVFGRAQVELALAEAKRQKAEAWGYCLSCLKRWRAGESEPTVPKREPPRPYHLPGPGPPPPDADALPPDEIAANIRAMLAGVAKAKP